MLPLHNGTIAAGRTVHQFSAKLRLSSEMAKLLCRKIGLEKSDGVFLPFFLLCRDYAFTPQCADAAYMYGHAHGDEQKQDLYQRFPHERVCGYGYYGP